MPTQNPKTDSTRKPPAETDDRLCLNIPRIAFMEAIERKAQKVFPPLATDCLPAFRRILSGAGIGPAEYERASLEVVAEPLPTIWSAMCEVLAPWSSQFNLWNGQTTPSPEWSPLVQHFTFFHWLVQVATDTLADLAAKRLASSYTWNLRNARAGRRICKPVGDPLWLEMAPFSTRDETKDVYRERAYAALEVELAKQFGEDAEQSAPVRAGAACGESGSPRSAGACGEPSGDPHGIPSRQSYTPAHYDWLALFQVEKQSYETIGKATNPEVLWDTVRKGVREAAERVIGSEAEAGAWLRSGTRGPKRKA